MSAIITKLSKELNLKRVDGKKPINLTVTATDIKNADKKNPHECAYARACVAKIPGVKAAFFFRATAWLQFKDRLVRYRLPPSVQKEIVSFDRNQTMEPGEYHLAPVNRHARPLKAKRKNNKHTGKGRKVNPNMVRHFVTNIRASGW